MSDDLQIRLDNEEYFLLNGNNSAPVFACCDVSDKYVRDLRYCPLEEMDSENLFICSSSCLYYSVHSDEC